MGRPRAHNEQTASNLLEAAERIVDAEGLDRLSVRRVANDVGVTTRAVYSLFGSKDALVVALGARAFDLLKEAIDALPTTSDPASDLVEAGAGVFRRFALDHPALLRIGVLQHGVSDELARQFSGAVDPVLDSLWGRVTRLAGNGQLGSREVADAAWAFHAVCEGLVTLELGGTFPRSRGESVWRDALGALVSGWRVA
jgi:AcrR family transcriptional regulator